MEMKDAARRGVVLRKFYDGRHGNSHSMVFLQRDPAIPEQEQLIEFNICKQLHQHGLIVWQPSSRGPVEGGRGRITADGIDVIEENVAPPIAITIDKRVSVSGSIGTQIGDRNVQDIRLDAETIFAAIDRSSVSAAQKQEAKSLWQKVIDNPLLSKVIGAIIGTGG